MPPAPPQDPSSSSTSSASRSARGWVSRACDRCRKRKARCDEANPCRNCQEAGVGCTHDKPVLKRGPRPRQHHHDLEDRLRSLEHLIASIPSAEASAVALTSNELDQIRFAAQPSPSRQPQPFSALPLQAMSNGHEPVKDESDDYSALWSASTPAANAWYPQFTPDVGPDVPSSSHRASISLGSLPLDIRPPATPSSSGHDLLYKDSEGQTRYLGPSRFGPYRDPS